MQKDLPTQCHPPAAVQRGGSAVSHSWSRVSAHGDARVHELNLEGGNLPVMSR